MTQFSSVSPRFGSLEIDLTQYRNHTRCDLRFIDDGDDAIKARALTSRSDGDFFVVGRCPEITNFPDPPASIRTSVLNAVTSYINFPSDEGWRNTRGWHNRGKRALRDLLNKHHSAIISGLPAANGTTGTTKQGGKPFRSYYIPSV